MERDREGQEKATTARAPPQAWQGVAAGGLLVSHLHVVAHLSVVAAVAHLAARWL